jgi:hypothetical protein
MVTNKMGIYYEYGIEYVGYDSDGKYITLLPIKVFDDRLIRSKYYEQREPFYRENYGSSWCTKIDVIDFIDIQLYDQERKVIQEASLKDQGFYDVSRVHSTL